MPRPPRPRAAPQAPARPATGPRARVTRRAAMRRRVPRPERPRRGRVRGHFQRRHRPSPDFAPVARCPSSGPSASNRVHRATMRPPGVPKSAEPEARPRTFRTSVLPDDAALLGPRRPRLAAAVRRGVLEPEGRPPRRRVGRPSARRRRRTRARTKRPRRREAATIDPPRSLTRHGTNERFVALPPKIGIGFAAALDEGASSEEARGRERRRGSRFRGASWRRAVRVDRRRGHVGAGIADAPDAAAAANARRTEAAAER